MEITDDQYSDRCFPSITLSVKFIQTDNVSYADRNNPWVKLLNFVVIMYNRQYNRQYHSSIYSLLVIVKYYVHSTCIG